MATVEMRTKGALIVGGTGGIGEATARRLAAEGWRVVISGSREQAAGDAVADTIDGATYVRADMEDPSAAKDVVEKAVGILGRLDALVYTAGATVKIPHADLAAADDAVWNRILSNNILGPWRTVLAAEPHLRQGEDSSIVFTGALAGVDVGGSSIPYAVSKAGLHHMVKLLGPVLGPEIRINAVAPGLIETPWTSAAGWGPLYDFVKEKTPMRRVGQAEDVAHIIVSLIGAKYTTGQTVVIDGGLSLV